MIKYIRYIYRYLMTNTNSSTNMLTYEKNPAYGSHWIFWHLRIVAPTKKNVMWHMSCGTCHLSPVNWHLSPVTCHLSTVTCHLSPVTCQLSYKTALRSPHTCFTRVLQLWCTKHAFIHNTSHNPSSIHRELFAEDLIPQHLQCGLEHLGYVIHGKFAFMFSSGAVFIRFMMVTRGEDIIMTSGVLRPNQASLKNITIIVAFFIATCSVTTFGGILVGLGIFKPLKQLPRDALAVSYNKTIFSSFLFDSSQVFSAGFASVLNFP